MSVSDQEMKTGAVETRAVAQSANGRTGGKGWKLQKSATKSVEHTKILGGRNRETDLLPAHADDPSLCLGSNPSPGTNECSRGPSWKLLKRLSGT